MSNDEWENFKKTVSPLKQRKRCIDIPKKNKTIKSKDKKPFQDAYEKLGINFIFICTGD